MSLILRLLAPYFAVGLFWCVWSNAWLAILAYHVQIVLWTLHERPEIQRISHKGFLLLSVPTIVTGGVLYVLFPYITHSDLSAWLTDHHLSRSSLLLMIPYFGVIHPFLEQLHWTRLRDRTPGAHPLFAGYHVLVLYSLVKTPWLIACFAVLVGASIAWRHMQKHTKSIYIPYLSHALADTGVIVATLLQ